MTQWLEKQLIIWKLGISVSGRLINTIIYADDKAVVANSQKELQQLTGNQNKVAREFGWNED